MLFSIMIAAADVPYWRAMSARVWPLLTRTFAGRGLCGARGAVEPAATESVLAGATAGGVRAGEAGAATVPAAFVAAESRLAAAGVEDLGTVGAGWLAALGSSAALLRSLAPAWLVPLAAFARSV